MWLFRHKFNADGSLSRYKAWLVANGRSQQQRLDCDETFSLVRIIALLHSEFAMTDLDTLNYFLCISAQRSASGMFLSKSKFVEEILERAHMQIVTRERILLIQSLSLVQMVNLLVTLLYTAALLVLFSILLLCVQIYLSRQLNSGDQSSLRGIDCENL
nr:uncharacterized mitochondrial protein AtMg00810-like [Tanacetum cinerariifolium]